MNTEALLALIGDIYGQLSAAQQEIARLRELLDETQRDAAGKAAATGAAKAAPTADPVT